MISFLAVVLLSGCVQPTSSPPTENELPDAVLSSGKTDVLIYGGPGSWRSEIQSIKNILYMNRATYQVLNTQDINQFSVADFLKYKAILFVGGDAITVKKSLNQDVRSKLITAIRSGGLNYIGFCAGAWLAVAPSVEADENLPYSIPIIDNSVLDLNYLSKKGYHQALDEAQFPDGHTRKMLWYGGPITPGSAGQVIAKYSDGTAAISQLRAGRGLVILSGLHPAATKPILKLLKLYEPEAVAPDFAWTLLEAAIEGTTLTSF